MERWRGNLPGPDTDKFTLAGLKIARITTDGLKIPGLRPIWVRERPTAPLRWGIRYSSIGGSKGDRWGDTSYAESLATALRHHGQEVVTYRHGANRETAHAFDDVNLVLRGLDHVSPIPGMINILWIISHPELIEMEEIRSFDIVYAASASWSRAMTRHSGRHVKALLQATDTDRFGLGEAGEPQSRPATFVGGTHPGRERKIVSDALAAGVDLRVIGGGWDDTLPKGVLEAAYVDNRNLSSVYRSASRVLADHWTEMAELGFIQNRLFDAVASGARVVSDDFVGLREVFGSAVQTYGSLEELRYLCSPEGGSRFGGDDEMIRQAIEVQGKHSFQARAGALLEDTLKVMAARHP